MPSPFPGMDPYLESPAIWPDCHTTLISEIREALNPALRPSYFAKVEARTLIPDAETGALHLIIPDAAVYERPAAGNVPPAGSGGGLAVAEAVDVTDVVLVDKIKEHYLEIRAVGSRELVTVIEVVSPANKVGDPADSSFARKRDDCLAAGVNWLEIDLVRLGRRPTAPWLMGEFAYRVYSDHSEGPRRRRLAWPIGLRDPLPTVAVPLKPEHGRVPLELQKVLDAAYDAAGYDLMVDYAGPVPAPPLGAADAAWADELLREKGLR